MAQIALADELVESLFKFRMKVLAGGRKFRLMIAKTAEESTFTGRDVRAELLNVRAALFAERHVGTVDSLRDISFCRGPGILALARELVLSTLETSGDSAFAWFDAAAVLIDVCAAFVLQARHDLFCVFAFLIAHPSLASLLTRLSHVVSARRRVNHNTQGEHEGSNKKFLHIGGVPFRTPKKQ